MVKPPPAICEEIADYGIARRADLLHITLAPLGDRQTSPAWLLDTLLAIGDAVRAPAFRVVFDLIVGSERPHALLASEPIRGALAFQAALVAALADAGLSGAADYRFAPHITLDYRAPASGIAPILPLSWGVDSFMLIESVTGEGRHIPHACWRLSSPPSPVRRPI